MWKNVWQDLRASRHLISLDGSHVRDDRDGRYQRALNCLGWILAVGEPIGFRYFRRSGDFDVCYLVVWLLEDYDDVGQYMVFRAYYTKQNYGFNDNGYRKFIAAEIACFYDGQNPNPGKALRDRGSAITCMLQKDGYHECT